MATPGRLASARYPGLAYTVATATGDGLYNAKSTDYPDEPDFPIAVGVALSF